ncbi:MAG: hypothetical protein E7161_03815 [Firmicutes bacterium]|nr:hypothetical protein [Bacillota bacterium]
MKSIRRINGYLDLDNYLSKNQVQESYIDYQYWITIDNEEYYFKLTKYPYAELLAYELATFLGFNATCYDLAIYEENKGVISKSYRHFGCNYISGNRILRDYIRFQKNVQISKEMGLIDNDYLAPRSLNNLEIIWQAIENRYKDTSLTINMKEIMDNIINQFIFYILAAQNDGMPHNWELEESPTKVSVVPIFDNEMCFRVKGGKYPANRLSTNFNDEGTSNYEILEEFLKVSSSEFIELFLEKFNLLSIDVFLQLIAKVEDKIGCEMPKDIKESYIHVFLFNIKQIELVLNKLGIASGRKF